MKKAIYMLAALMCLQAVFAVLAWFEENRNDEKEQPERLLSFNPEEITEIEISGSDNNKVILRKKGGSWLLPEHFSFPADNEAVKKLLDRLHDLKTGWPVATTKDAFERFKVGPENFKRLLTLRTDNENIGSLFLGTSPGVKKIHARAGDSNDIYEVKFTLFQASADPDTWIDRKILRLEEPAVISLKLPGLELVRDESGLQPSDLGANETVVKNAVDSLVRKVCTLTIDGVLGMEKPDGFEPEKSDFTLTVTTKPDNRVREYIFAKPDGDSYWILKVSDKPEYFKVAEWLVKSLKNVNRLELVTSGKSK